MANLGNLGGKGVDVRTRLVQRLIEIGLKDCEPRQLHVAVSACKAAIEAIDAERGTETDFSTLSTQEMRLMLAADPELRKLARTWQDERRTDA